jgi:hypothetical protein
MRLGVPFIAPRQLGAVEDKLGRPSMPSVEWRTGQSGARFPSKSGTDDRCSSVPVDEPDIVRCPPPTDRWSCHASPADFAADRWRWLPLAHRTVRWIIAMSPFPFPESDEFAADDSPDSPVHHRTVRWIIVVHRRQLPRAAFSPETSLAHRTLSGAPPDSPVCQSELKFGCSQPSLLQSDSSLFGTVSSTYTNNVSSQKQCTKSRNVPFTLICTFHTFSTLVLK